VARRIASENGRVAIADLDAEAGATIVADIGASCAHFVHCDVRSASHAHVQHSQRPAHIPLQDLITHLMACGWDGIRPARRSEDSIAGAFDAAVDHFGALHGAVLAAGIVNRSHRTPLSDITAEEFDDTCAVNLRGSFLCLKHAARQVSHVVLAVVWSHALSELQQMFEHRQLV
jgi:NAD(P)-dependent dehydrogenase (short-subunit alcohol dehydrogenase family)